MKYSHPNVKDIHEKVWSIDYRMVSSWIQSTYNRLGGSDDFIEIAKKIIDGEVDDSWFGRVRKYIHNKHNLLALSVTTPKGHIEGAIGKGNEGHLQMSHKVASKGVTFEILFDALAGNSMPGSILMTVTKNLLTTRFEAFYTSPLIIEIRDKDTFITVRVLYEYRDGSSIQIKNSFFLELRGKPYEIYLNEEGTVAPTQILPHNVAVIFNTQYFVTVNNLEIQFPRTVDLQHGIIKHFLKNKQLLLTQNYLDLNG